MENIDIMSLADLRILFDDLQQKKIGSDKINLKIYTKKIYYSNDIKKFIDLLAEITSWENLYIIINELAYDHSSDYFFMVVKRLIELIPEKIIKIKLNFDGKKLDFNKLNLSKAVNLKKLSVINCPLSNETTDFLCDLLKNNIHLEHLIFSSGSCLEPIYYEDFLNKIANVLRSNRNLQNFRIDIKDMFYDIENKPYYKAYMEIKSLIANNKYKPEKLIVLYRDLQEYIKTVERTKQIYDSAQEANSIIKSAIDEAQLIIKDKTTIFDNSVKFAINNVQNNKVVAEAIFMLTEQLKLSDPKQAYELLMKIPDHFQEIYRQANYSMAHILLSIEDSDYKTIDLPRNDQDNKPDKMQMICSHLSESGSQNKELLEQIFHEYVFGDGLSGDNNPFKLAKIEPKLFPKTSSLLFVLDTWRQHYKSADKVMQQNQDINVNSNVCTRLSNP